MNYIKKVWFILSPSYKKKSIFLFFLILTSTILEVMGIGLIIPAILFLLEDDVLTKYPFLYGVVNFFYDQPNKIQLVQFSLFCLIGIYFIKNAFLVFFSYFESKFAWGVKADISKKLFERYINEELSFYYKKNSAYLLNNIVKETAVCFHTIMHLIIFISEIFVFSGIALLLLYYQPMGFVIVSAVSFLVIGTYSLLTSKKLVQLGKKRQEQDGLMVQKIQQGLAGIREIKIYNRESSFLNLFQKSNYELYNISWLNQLIQKLPRVFLEFATVLALVIVVLTFLNLNFTTNYIITILGLFALAAARILPSLSRIYKSAQTIKFGFPSIELLYNELSLVKEERLTNKNNNTIYTGKKLNFSDSIKMQNVSFSYSGNGTKIFDKINFAILKGKSIGIHGPSGSGKSTLVDIMLGLLKPDEGKVLVDEVNIQENISGWQKNISYVPQTVFLTDDKLKRNIAFGLDDNDIDQKRLQEAVFSSELDEFVKSLPAGLETVIGEKGSRLSGGQRQRIGLARALYHKPELLVLDETTSSVETEVEKKIMETISKIKKNITVVIISHDNNVLSNCDIIYSIQNKKVLNKK